MDRFLVVSSMMLIMSFCSVLASAQQGAVDQIHGPGSNVSTSLATGVSEHNMLAMVQGTQSNLFLNVQYSEGGYGPICFIDTWQSANITRWTKPCPRTPQVQIGLPVGFWCMFEFTADGNLVLSSGPNALNKAENPTMLWSSNTTGSGATSLVLLDSDVQGVGNMVLYCTTPTRRSCGETLQTMQPQKTTVALRHPILRPLGIPDEVAPAPGPFVGVPDEIAPTPFGSDSFAPAPAPMPQSGRKLLMH